MIDNILIGLAAVLIAEGLVYLLAPHALETLLKALSDPVALCAPTNGSYALCWWVHPLGAESVGALQAQ